MPPFRSVTLKELERDFYDEDPRIIHLLYEGQNTEHLVINPLLSSNSIITHSHVRFKQIEKTGKDTGVTTPELLIENANKKIDELAMSGEFRLGKDKVLVVFDLDVFENDQEKMNNLLDLKYDDVILAYTNPAIELFLLLSNENAVNNILTLYKNKILENDWVIKGKDRNGNTIKERYICDLVMRYLEIDPKNQNTDFSFVLENIEHIFKQEEQLNRKLTKAANQLTCNIAYILTKIKNDDYDIEY